MESKQGPFEHYGSTLKTRPKCKKKKLITSTVAATGPIPETSCISTHTMENVQRSMDIKTQICLYLSIFLKQGPVNSAGQISVSLETCSPQYLAVTCLCLPGWKSQFYKD